MAKPPRPSKGVRVLFYLAVAPIWVLVIFIQVLCRFLLIGPFCLISPSANWGLFSSRDVEPVRVYLQHFRTLHPDLINYYATQVHQWARDDVLEKIRYWPSKAQRSGCVMPGYCSKTTEWEFTYEAAFFATLEAKCYPREKLWEFLRDEVERHVILPESVRADYRRVMGMMNRCNIDYFLRVFDWLNKPIMEAMKKGVYTMPEQTPPGMNVIAVNKDDLQWFTSPGALLVPMSVAAEDQIRLMHQCGFLGQIESDAELEKGLTGQKWATHDFR